MNSEQHDNWITGEEFIAGMVSVIIPNYNHARYLSDAIDSILAQTYSNYEILVIDDGSTDNSREVAAQYGDKINYIYKDNAGLSAARNTGIRRSKGEFIALLDADDMYQPEFMQTLVQVLKTRKAVDGVYCGYQFYTDEGEPMSQIENRVFPDDQMYKTFWGANYWVPECVIMRRKCYETAGPYDESLRALEDWDVWLRILAQHRVTGLTDVLIRHRALPNSMSSDPVKMNDNRFAVMKNRFGTFEQPKPEFAQDIGWIYGNAYFTGVIEYLQADDEETACDMLEKAVVCNPEIIEGDQLFYELAVGSQPKGDRGDLSQLNLVEKQATLDKFINRLFGSDLLKLNQAQQGQMRGRAYFNLAKLAYAAKNNTQARKFLTKAIMTDKSFGTNSEFMGLYARTIVGPQVVNALKRESS